MLVVLLYNLTLRKLNYAVFDYAVLPILATILPILWSTFYNDMKEKLKIKKEAN